MRYKRTYVTAVTLVLQAEADLLQKTLAALEDARMKEAQELAQKVKEAQDEWQRLQVRASKGTSVLAHVCSCMHSACIRGLSVFLR